MMPQSISKNAIVHGAFGSVLIVWPVEKRWEITEQENVECCKNVC